MKEIGQQQQLAQLEQRIEKLNALSRHLAQSIQGLHSQSEVEYNRFAHYNQILREQINAVLAYQKVAQHWPKTNKQRAKELLDQAIASHQYLHKLLQQQCELLYHKIQNIDLPQKTIGYNTGHHIGQMFDFKG